MFCMFLAGHDAVAMNCNVNHTEDKEEKESLPDWMLQTQQETKGNLWRRRC